MNMMYNKNIKKAHAGHTRNRRECTMKSKKLAALGLTAGQKGGAAWLRPFFFVCFDE